MKLNLSGRRRGVNKSELLDSNAHKKFSAFYVTTLTNVCQSQTIKWREKIFEIILEREVEKFHNNFKEFN